MEDVEEQKGWTQPSQLNDVHSFNWTVESVSVNKASQTILQDSVGSAKAGELVAIMGPSGCGKTTLLNTLAQRSHYSNVSTRGCVEANDRLATAESIRRIARFVEQDDVLTGSLTIRETIDFAARLSLPRRGRRQKVNELLNAFGLMREADLLVGTPIRKGISGGQKRRLSIATQLVTNPNLLFLDEPTSGLDSVASYEVMSYLRSLTKSTGLIVIASVHQPSTSTFNSFDKLVLLSQGRQAFSGYLAEAADHFATIGYPYPSQTNPAEHLVDMINVDFAKDENAAQTRLDSIFSAWSKKQKFPTVSRGPEGNGKSLVTTTSRSRPSLLMIILVLIHRSLVKSYRDVFAYGIRLMMYLGLAILMGTVWLRLHTTQANIQSFINAIFFGGAFMSFMAVAYIPAFLEDRAIFMKERANGLYGPTAFMVTNFIVGLPFLFVITILFSVVAYWLTGFRPSGGAFWTWIMWIYLDLLAAESLVVLVSGLVPIFVAALAIAAFANGLWMCVGGFLVQPQTLNVFWRYVFHYIDYQAYVFQGMMVNEFKSRTFDCGSDCQCMYTSDLASKCHIEGTAILSSYGYRVDRQGKWVGILIAIIFTYRILGYLVLVWRRS